MSKKHLISLIAILLIAISCKKEQEDAPQEINKQESFTGTLTLANAPDLYRQLKTKAENSRQTEASGTDLLSPLWNISDQSIVNGTTIVSTPILQNVPLYWGDKGFRRLIMKQNPNGTTSGFYIEAIASDDYFYKQCYGAYEFKNFSGKILVYDLNYNFLTGADYGNGVRLNLIKVLEPGVSLQTANTKSTDALGALVCVRVYRKEPTCLGGININSNMVICDYILKPDEDPINYLGAGLGGYDGFGLGDNYVKAAMGTGSGGGIGIGGMPAPQPITPHKLIASGSSLSLAQMNAVKTIIEQIRNESCMMRTVVNYLETYGRPFIFSVDLTLNILHGGIYDPKPIPSPFSKTIKFKDPVSIEIGTLREELIHAFQDLIYPGGIHQYNGTLPGSANIEFEAKFIVNLDYEIRSRSGLNGMMAFTVFAMDYNDYAEWIRKIASNKYNGGGYPLYSDLSSKYYQFQSLFPNLGHGYENTKVKTDLAPHALYYLLSRGCN